MTRYTYVGRLTDFGRSPFAAADNVRLWVVPSHSAVGSLGPMSDRRIPVVLESNGDFEVRLEASDHVRPPVLYTLWAEWLRGADPLGWSEWCAFRAITGGGAIRDSVDAPAPAGAILYGWGPPPSGMRPGFYIDISGVDPVLYAPEGAGV